MIVEAAEERKKSKRRLHRRCSVLSRNTCKHLVTKMTTISPSCWMTGFSRNALEGSIPACSQLKKTESDSRGRFMSAVRRGSCCHSCACVWTHSEFLSATTCYFLSEEKKKKSQIENAALQRFLSEDEAEARPKVLPLLAVTWAHKQGLIMEVQGCSPSSTPLTVGPHGLKVLRKCCFSFWFLASSSEFPPLGHFHNLSKNKYAMRNSC